MDRDFLNSMYIVQWGQEALRIVDTFYARDELFYNSLNSLN